VAVVSYKVKYQRDESNWWVATVVGVRGCHTQGRTLAEAERRIREALGLFFDDAETATLKPLVRLAPAAKKQIAAHRLASSRLEDAQRRARSSAAAAVKTLSKMGLSYRDIGQLLGLSHQRVQQIAKSALPADALEVTPVAT
jgi:predicted RNase H-like HicB family nuclease